MQTAEEIKSRNSSGKDAVLKAVTLTGLALGISGMVYVAKLGNVSIDAWSTLTTVIGATVGLALSVGMTRISDLFRRRTAFRTEVSNATPLTAIVHTSLATRDTRLNYIHICETTIARYLDSKKYFATITEESDEYIATTKGIDKDAVDKMLKPIIASLASKEFLEIKTPEQGSFFIFPAVAGNVVYGISGYHLKHAPTESQLKFVTTINSLYGKSMANQLSAKNELERIKSLMSQSQETTTKLTQSES